MLQTVGVHETQCAPPGTGSCRSDDISGSFGATTAYFAHRSDVIVHTVPGLSPAESFNGKYYINEESSPGGEIAVTDGNTFWTGIAEEWGGMCTYANGVVFNGYHGLYTSKQ